MGCTNWLRRGAPRLLVATKDTAAFSAKAIVQPPETERPATYRSYGAEVRRGIRYRHLRGSPDHPKNGISRYAARPRIASPTHITASARPKTGGASSAVTREADSLLRQQFLPFFAREMSAIDHLQMIFDTKWHFT